MGDILAVKKKVKEEKKKEGLWAEEEGLDWDVEEAEEEDIESDIEE